MIGIINIGKFDETGINEYELRINQKVIGRFKHNRSKGLADCLKQAAKCAKKAKRKNKIKQLCTKLETFHEIINSR